MKELQEILKKLNQMPSDETAVLATVIDVQGSAYRRAGAKMLICESGETFGTVSGGCLEADVLERAKKVLKTGEAQVFVYDTGKNEDSVFSLNMGCRGVIRILLEPIAANYILHRIFLMAAEHRFSQATATLISADSEIDVQIGGKVFYSDFKQFEFECLPNFLIGLQLLLDDVKKIVQNEKSFGLRTYQIEEGSFEFFFDVIKPPLSLYIFGAGADAVPLYEIARTLGWQVFVIDHRAVYAASDRFPDANGIFVLHPEDYAGNFKPDAYSMAVVMTHNYEKDKQIQKFLLQTSAGYIGALGPRKRTEKLLAEIGADWPANLYAPVGLDIGAETPEEIALAIVAEIQSVLKNRRAGFLRDKKNGIHAD